MLIFNGNKISDVWPLFNILGHKSNWNWDGSINNLFW